MTIAPHLPANWSKRLVDTNVERLTDQDLAWADVALISGMHAEHLVAIVDRCRALGLRTVVGGPITSSMSAADLHAQHIVIGMTLAVKGYRFQIMTERLPEAD